MTLNSTPNPSNVLNLGEIHLEKKSRTRPKRQQILLGQDRATSAHRRQCPRSIAAVYASSAPASASTALRFITMLARICLSILMAAPVPVHIPISPDIDQHVETILAAAKPTQKIIARPARLERHIQHLPAPRRAPFAHGLI